MEEQVEKKKSRAPLVILAVALCLGMAVSCAISGLALWRITQQGDQMVQLSAQISSAIGDEDDHVTQEDDVKVAGEYMILSTLPISDAYKSGDDSALDDEQKETLEMASAVLDEIIDSGMTDYEKEKAVYDWMCANLKHEGGVTVAVPTTSEESSRPHGVLKYKSAVCVGFATTFRMFMQMMDIECMVVHNSYHSWDLVKLDGEWYHTDIYSDVDTGNYANFNMTDSLCTYNHHWDTSFFPAANGLTYCYAYQNSVKIEDPCELPAHLREAADNGKTATLYFLIDSTDENLSTAMDEMMMQLDGAITQYAASKGSDMWMYYSTSGVDDKPLLTVTLDCGNEKAQLTEEEQGRIQQAVEDAFGDVWNGEGGEGGESGWDGGDGNYWGGDMPAAGGQSYIGGNSGCVTFE